MNLTKLLLVLTLAVFARQGLNAQAGIDCIGGVSIIAPGNVSSLTLCQGDGLPDVVRFRTSKLPTPFGYLVVNQNNTIVYQSTNNNINFEILSPGTYQVYAFSFIGQLINQVGQQLNTAQLATVCFELTINSITVINTTPTGGSVSTATGAASAFACPGDGNADLIQFSTTSSSPSYVYLITDENNVIIEVVSGAGFDFENSAQGVSRVWGLAYAGTLLAQPGQNAATAQLATQCFALSDNFIEIEKTTPDGGTVSLTNGETVVSVCTGGGPTQLNFQASTTSNAPYVYLLTDESNVVLAIINGNSLDFNAFPSGTSRVWGLSYIGNLSVNVGDNAATTALSDGCYDLSDNFITATKQNIDGGAVSLITGATATDICINENPSAPVFAVTTSTSPNYYYVLTDTENVIIGAYASGDIDLGNLAPGAYRIWGLAITGNLLAEAGDDADLVVLADECYELSDNFIDIKISKAVGGALSLDNGDDTATICSGDGQPDNLTVNADGAFGDNYLYVFTDENNVIVGVSTDPTSDLDNNTGDAVRIWGLAYSGNVTAQIGDDADQVTLADGCYDLSSNFILINRTFVDGGTISTIDGATNLVVCNQDDVNNVVNFIYDTQSSASYGFVMTDADNTVLAFLLDNSRDFGENAPGNYRVWGFSYTGNITVQLGDNAGATPLSDGCYELSSNFVDVRVQEVDGGALSLPGGDAIAYTCPGDGNADVVDYISTGTSSANYAYVITDENNTILAVTDQTSFDFDGLPAGNCRIWGLAYSGNLTAQIGDNAGAVTISDECYDLSDNFITVVRETPNGGSVATAEGETLVYSCPDGGSSDVINFAANGNSGTPYLFVLTDANNIIINTSTTGTFDVGALPEGAYRVWGLAYTGDIIAQAGDDAGAVDLSDDCFDLSDDFVTILRQPAEGGTVQLEGGVTNIAICPGDSIPTVLNYSSTGATGNGFVFLVTDLNNVIIALTTDTQLDASSLGLGNFRIWGLAYNGNLLAEAGMDAASATLADGCYDLSSNFIEVLREAPNGGTIATTDGLNAVDLCVGDGSADLIEYEATGTSGANYAFLITDENDFLIGIVTESSFDFENAIGGNWRIYGVAYIGQLLPFPGDNIFETQLASECWDLTDNFLAINKTQVDGGTIFGDGNSDILYVCATDGNPDIVTFVNSSLATDASYQYVITTETNVILALINGNQQNFEITGFNRLRVWGISYSGTLQAGLGNIITSATLSSECYSLSDNFITIVRDIPEGGDIAADGNTGDVTVCIGAEDGILDMTNTSTSNSGYVYLVTTPTNVLLDIIEGSQIDFNAFTPGDYHIWGLSYTGNILIEPGQAILVTDLASSCFELSGNFISVTRSEPTDGGTLSTPEGLTTIYTCPGDDTADVVQVFTTSTLGDDYRLVITDTDNRILIPNINGDIINFDAASPGEVRIYGISLLGNFTAGFGDVVGVDPLADDCFDVSNNYITVIIGIPQAGTVSTVDGDSSLVLLTSDGQPDVVEFTATGASNTPYAYLITDSQYFIVQHVVTGNSFDFEGELQGTSYVWGLAYTGNLTVSVGDTASTAILSDDCFELSDNYISIQKSDGNLLGQNAGLSAQNDNNPSQPLQVSVFPNPANDKLTALWSLDANTPQQALVRILNTNGQEVERRQMTVPPGDYQLELQVQALTPGIYFLQVQQDSELQTVRFVKK